MGPQSLVSLLKWCKNFVHAVTKIPVYTITEIPWYLTMSLLIFVIFFSRALRDHRKNLDSSGNRYSWHSFVFSAVFLIRRRAIVNSIYIEKRIYPFHRQVKWMETKIQVEIERLIIFRWRMTQRLSQIQYLNLHNEFIGWLVFRNR